MSECFKLYLRAFDILKFSGKLAPNPDSKASCMRRSYLSNRQYVYLQGQLPFISSSAPDDNNNNNNNKEQIITDYPIDGALGSSGGWRVWKLSVVCLHINAIVARCILVTLLHCGTPKPCLSAIFFVRSVGISLIYFIILCVLGFVFQYVYTWKNLAWEFNCIPS